MIGLVMAGGKGIRMQTAEEKLLLEYEKPIILHVINALENSGCFSKVIAVTSPNSPQTRELLVKMGIEVFDTFGTNYVNDLNSFLALSENNELVFVTSGDLPLLDEQMVRQIVSECDESRVWTSYLVTDDFLKSLGIKRTDTPITFQDKKCSFTGISIVDAKKITTLNTVKVTFEILDDKRVAYNINTKEDYELLGAS